VGKTGTEVEVAWVVLKKNAARNEGTEAKLHLQLSWVWISRAEETAVGEVEILISK